MITHGNGRKQNHDNIGIESRSRVHKHTNEDSRHCERYNINTQNIVLHHQRSYCGEDDEQGIQERNRAWLLKIVLAEESHVKRKQQDKYENVKRLPKEGRRNLVFRFVTLLVCLFKRVKNTIGFRIYNIATVDNPLSFKHHTRSLRNKTEHIVHFAFVAFLVVNKVRFDIFVQIALLQYGTFGTQQLCGEKVFVSPERCEELSDRLAYRLFAHNNVHNIAAVFHQRGEIGRIDNACFVEFVQSLRHNINILRW